MKNGFYSIVSNAFQKAREDAQSDPSRAGAVSMGKVVRLAWEQIDIDSIDKREAVDNLIRIAATNIAIANKCHSIIRGRGVFAPDNTKLEIIFQQFLRNVDGDKDRAIKKLANMETEYEIKVGSGYFDNQLAITDGGEIVQELSAESLVQMILEMDA